MSIPVFPVNTDEDWDFMRRTVRTHKGNVAATGAPSIGKSFMFLHSNGPVIPVQCHEGMLAQDLFMARVFENGTMRTVPAFAGIAARDSVPLLLQELDRLMEESQSVVYSLADEPKSRRITYTDSNGELVELKPNDDYRVFATSNHGPDRLPEALADRFVWFDVQAPPSEALADFPEHMREAARVLAGHPDPLQRVSLRSFRRYVNMQAEGFTAEESAKAGFGSRWESFIDAERLAGLVDTAASSR